MLLAAPLRRRPGLRHPAGRLQHQTLIGFLRQLHNHLGTEQKVTLIWDGLPSHRSRAMSNFIHDQRAWLRVERLPGYAPDLNPVEGLWGNVKGTELANLCADTIAEATDAAHRGLNRVRANTDLCFALLRHTRPFTMTKSSLHYAKLFKRSVVGNGSSPLGEGVSGAPTSPPGLAVAFLHELPTCTACLP